MSKDGRHCKAHLVPRKTKGDTKWFWSIHNHRGDALAISPKRYSTPSAARKPLVRFVARGGFKLKPINDDKDCRTFIIC